MTFPKWFFLVVLICFSILSIAVVIWFKPVPVPATPAAIITINADTAVQVTGSAQFDNYPVVKADKIKTNN